VIDSAPAASREELAVVLVAMVPFLFLQRYYIRVVAAQADR
jgi:hypothetical protein